MMGRRFAFANPTPVSVNILISVASDTHGTQVQVTDPRGTETQIIHDTNQLQIVKPAGSFSWAWFSRSNVSSSGIKIEAEADVSVSIQIGGADQTLEPTKTGFVPLICIPDKPSQHFIISTAQGDDVQITVVSLSNDNTILVKQQSSSEGQGINAQLQEMDRYSIRVENSTMISCSGLCSVYSYLIGLESAVREELVTPEIPIQFYPSEYYVSFEPQTTVCVQGIQKQTSVEIVTDTSTIQLLDPTDSIPAKCHDFEKEGTAIITCSSACQALIKTSTTMAYRYIDVFSSTFKSNELPVVGTADTYWIVGFDYGVTVNRTFSEAISLELLQSTGDLDPATGEIQTTFWNEGTKIFKVSLVKVPAGAYRMSDTTNSDPSPIYIHGTGLNDSAYLLPIYTASQTFPSQSVDLCNTPIQLCHGDFNTCHNIPESFTYACEAIGNTSFKFHFPRRMYKRATNVVPCYPGTKVNLSDNTCVECDFGEYQPDHNQTECLQCSHPERSVTMQRGSTSENQCVGGTTADLSDRQIFSLNDIESLVHGLGITHLEVVSDLILSENSITEVPSSIFKNFRNLVRLELSYNKISNINNSAFEGLDKLRSLFLSGNKLEALDSTALSGLQNVTDLRLSDNLIRTIAANTWSQTPQLRTLALSYNNVSAISEEEFRHFNTCTTLWLVQSNVRSIAPGTFQYATSLQTLDLSSNSLEFLQDSTFEGLGSLTSLTLRDCNLNENKLSASWTSGLTSLVNLYLDSNEFERLTPEMFVNYLTKLTGLYFYQNKINHVDAFTFSGEYAIT